jgi:hypothetical protein
MRHRSEHLGSQTNRQLTDAAPKTFRSRELIVLVVEDHARLSEPLRPVCEFIGVTVEVVGPHDDLTALIRDRQPISIITQLDTQMRDCCSVMQAVAEYDRALPILVVAGPEDALLGMVDAVEDLLALSNVTKAKVMPGCGEIADFLFKACRKNGGLSLIPT